MAPFLDSLKRYAASPGTGIILLNLGILIEFLFQPEPGFYPWITYLSRTVVVLSAVASVMYLAQKSDLGPKLPPPKEQIRFEDRGTIFLRLYQIGLPVMILFLCGFILFLFRKIVAHDGYILTALMMAALVQGKILWNDIIRAPFVLRITDEFLSMNLKGYEVIYWDEVDEIEWDTQEINFELIDDEEHAIGFGKMIQDKEGFLKAVQEQARQHKIEMEKELVDA